jgi:hypothetical protein
MHDELIEAIRNHVIPGQQRPIAFGPAAAKDVEEAEQSLGFEIPKILKLLYLRVGNGGFGPGRRGNIIGLRGGFASSSGTLVQLYEDMRRGAEYLGLQWRPGLLPFCEWGCTIFSCVDCKDPALRVYLCEACRAQAMDYGLDDFVKMWVEGRDLLSQSPTRRRGSVPNPFDRGRTDL